MLRHGSIRYPLVMTLRYPGGYFIRRNFTYYFLRPTFHPLGSETKHARKRRYSSSMPHEISRDQVLIFEHARKGRYSTSMPNKISKDQVVFCYSLGLSSFSTKPMPARVARLVKRIGRPHKSRRFTPPDNKTRTTYTTCMATRHAHENGYILVDEIHSIDFENQVNTSKVQVKESECDKVHTRLIK